MQKLVATILMLWWAALASPVIGYAHDAQHEREDLRLAADAKKKGLPDPGPQKHDDSNCVIHALMHAPIAPASSEPLLIANGEWVRFLTELPAQPVSQGAFDHIHSRGPPR